MTDNAVSAASECDIVMKGGITSGIVYPGLVVTLAEKYRFRQIGGASAGAIAATMAAAAEVSRRGETPAPDDCGFPKLARIPGELAPNMSKLFQPSASTATAFDVLMAWISPGRAKWMKVATVIGVLIRRASAWFAIAVVVAMVSALVFDVALLGVPRTVGEWAALIAALVVWLPVAVVAGIAVAAVVELRSTVTALNENGFGLCDCHSARRGVNFPPLTDWMETTLRQVAGLAATDGAPPLCFRDLWGEAATAQYREALSVGQGEAAHLSPRDRCRLRALRYTDCVVTTTDLTHRRPYRFPFDTAEFYWCPRCLRDYFPANVIAEMRRCTTEVSQEGVDTTCPRHHEALWHMPLAPDIPVVVAARISLSFPPVISAVPLQAIDWTRSAEHRGAVTVWFSDGGICSNFPIRFFDVPWPQRPTFGISLAPPDQDHPDEMVWRPRPGRSGRLPRQVPISTMGQFAGAILDTMQNWSDSTQMTMPGFRDRVVEIRLRPNEGGMNLQMLPDVIAEVAKRGTDAGANLLQGDAATPPFDFEMHRWMRYRDAMASLDDFLTGMHDGWQSEKAFLDTVTLPPDLPQFKAGDNDRMATAKTMQLAEDLATLGHPATLGDVPRPQPDLRLTPPL